VNIGKRVERNPARGPRNWASRKELARLTAASEREKSAGKERSRTQDCYVKKKKNYETARGKSRGAVGGVEGVPERKKNT